MSIASGFDPQKLHRTDIREVEDRSLRELEAHVVPRSTKVEQMLEEQRRAEADPNRVEGDQRVCFARIALHPEPIEWRCQAFGWERDRELNARDSLERKGIVEVSGVIGNKLKIFGPTRKGREMAKELGLPVCECKSGLLHEAGLRLVKKAMTDGLREHVAGRPQERAEGWKESNGRNGKGSASGQGVPAGSAREDEWSGEGGGNGQGNEKNEKQARGNRGIVFHEKGYARELDGVQCDSVATIPGGIRWAIQLCDGNKADYEVSRLCQLCTLCVIDRIISVSVTSATRKKIERELERQVGKSLPPKMVVTDLNRCLKAEFDWGRLLEPVGDGYLEGLFRG